jgi:HAD superfamily hydrolase (TIGR01549 family)
MKQITKKDYIDKKVIFFDCYQTLLDISLDKENQNLNEQKGWERFVNLLSQNHGIKISASDFISFFNRRKIDFYIGKDKTVYHHNLLSLISEVLEKDLKNKLLDEEILYLIYEYRKISRGYLELYPKVAETLALLSEKYILAIASYTQSSFTQPELKELGIEKYFSYFIFSSDIGFRKTSTEFYKKCLQIVGKNPEECVMIGDNYREDVFIPSQLGINGIWIKNSDSVFEYADLITAEAKSVVDLKEFNKLPKMVDDIFNK